ncbi:MAG: hypothetical protein PHF37_00845 [Phycisphaerae bacterium]|nr:hypothetical protein [Phycisphaerae bacterium]
MKQSGQRWWIVIPLSGYSVIIIIMVVSLQFFSTLRAGKRVAAEEHPLTTSPYYLVFYDAAPLLGAILGSIIATNTYNAYQYLLTLVMGSLFMTFFTWVVADPLLQTGEMYLPSSRKLRQQRIEMIRAENRKRQEANERLLAQLEADSIIEEQVWQKRLEPAANELCELFASQEWAEECRMQAIEYGVKAWQMGGLGCMKKMHDLALEKYRQKYSDPQPAEMLEIWWDGIGSWQSKWAELEV